MGVGVESLYIGVAGACAKSLGRDARMMSDPGRLVGCIATGGEFGSGWALTSTWVANTDTNCGQGHVVRAVRRHPGSWPSPEGGEWTPSRLVGDEMGVDQKMWAGAVVES